MEEKGDANYDPRDILPGQKSLVPYSYLVCPGTQVSMRVRGRASARGYKGECKEKG